MIGRGQSRLETSRKIANDTQVRRRSGFSPDTIPSRAHAFSIEVRCRSKIAQDEVRRVKRVKRRATIASLFPPTAVSILAGSSV